MGVLPERSELSIVTRLHGGSAGGPARRANLTVLIGVLESLDESQRFVDASTDWQIANCLVTQDALIIDDVSRTERDTCIATILNETAVILSNLVRLITQHRDRHWSKTALVSGLLGVLHVSEVRVDGATDELSVQLLELSLLVIELTDFSWAHKGEIQRPEEQTNVLAYRQLKNKGLPLNCSREICWNLFCQNAVPWKAGAALRMIAFCNIN